MLKEQFPKLSSLPLRVIQPEGTDNTMYKLGDDRVVRLPRTEGSAKNIEKECLWLPKFAPLLPISIPTPLGIGQPNETYPFPWFICQFLEGENPINENKLDLHQAAIDLGNFVAAMQKVDTKNGPLCRRGMPLQSKNQETQEAIENLAENYDLQLLIEIWQHALADEVMKYAPYA